MIVIVQNRSKKKAFRRTKRILSAVLPSISNRLNIGDIPKRVLLQLFTTLRHQTTRGVSIKLFVADGSGFRGFKCYEFGPKTIALRDFVNVDAKLDVDLIAAGLLSRPKAPTPLKFVEHLDV